jgi:hypothetical protein
MKPHSVDSTDQPSGVSDLPRAATPETSTWDARDDTEIELIGDHEPFDEVDLDDENWAPGQPPPGVPVEEVLHVHLLTEREEAVDELEAGGPWVEYAARDSNPEPAG